MVFNLNPFFNLHGHIGYERKFENMVIQWFNSLSFKLFLTIITRNNKSKISKASQNVRKFRYKKKKKKKKKSKIRDRDRNLCYYLCNVIRRVASLLKKAVSTDLLLIYVNCKKVRSYFNMIIYAIISYCLHFIHKKI